MTRIGCCLTALLVACTPPTHDEMARHVVRSFGITEGVVRCMITRNDGDGEREWRCNHDPSHREFICRSTYEEMNGCIEVFR